MKYVLAVVLVGMLAGCNSPSITYTRNMQRSNLRSVGDTTVTGALDAISDPLQADLVREDVKEIAEKIREFIYSGDIELLPVDEVRQRLEGIVPVEYTALVDFLMAKISGYTVDTSVIGPNNLRRIDAACVGVIMGCNEYRLEDRDGYEYSRFTEPVEDVRSVGRGPSMWAIRMFNHRLWQNVKRMRP